MVDFSLLGGTPNYLNLYRSSYDAGRERTKDDRVQNALKTASADIVGAEKELMQLGAFDDAAQLRKIRVDQARAKAAKAAATMDYTGGALAAAEAGDVGLASDMAAQGRNVTLGKQVAGGDTSGASTAALEAGDFDTAAAIGQLDDRERKLALAKNDTLGSIAWTLRDVPYAQRKAALVNIGPQLKSQGFTDEEIQQITAADPTDENLQAVIGQAMTLKEAVAASKPQLRTVGDGGVVFDDRTGKPVFENKKNFSPKAGGGGSSSAASSMSDEELFALVEDQ